jgi:protoheme IX farnesyltransferase
MTPWFIGGTGMVYGLAAFLLSGMFLWLSIKVGLRTATPGDGMKPEKRLFAYSIFYLFILFAMLVVDHYATLLGLQP